MNCPHCSHTLTEAEIKTAWASLTQSKRVTKTGGHNGGRPLKTDRCPCGRFTVHTARTRHHRCEPQTEARWVCPHLACQKTNVSPHPLVVPLYCKHCGSEVVGELPVHIITVAEGAPWPPKEATL